MSIDFRAFFYKDGIQEIPFYWRLRIGALSELSAWLHPPPPPPPTAWLIPRALWHTALHRPKWKARFLKIMCSTMQCLYVCTIGWAIIYIKNCVGTILVVNVIFAKCTVCINKQFNGKNAFYNKNIKKCFLDF